MKVIRIMAIDRGFEEDKKSGNSIVAVYCHPSVEERERELRINHSNPPEIPISIFRLRNKHIWEKLFFPSFELFIQQYINTKNRGA
jgi:hypothetical protein